MFYNPGNHRLYTELLNSKSSNRTEQALQNFIQFVSKFPD